MHHLIYSENMYLRQQSVSSGQMFTFDNIPGPMYSPVNSVPFYPPFVNTLPHYMRHPILTQTLPIMNLPTPPPAMSEPGLQTRMRDAFPQDSRNELRSAVFSNVLNSFPDLKKKLIESAKPKLSADTNSYPTKPKTEVKGEQKSDCRFADTIGRPDATTSRAFTPPDSVLFPCLTIDELDSGYTSCSDGSPPTSGGHLSSYPVAVELTPHLTHLIDSVMDSSPVFDDIMSDHCDVTNSPPVQSPISSPPTVSPSFPHQRTSPLQSADSYNSSSSSSLSPSPVQVYPEDLSYRPKSQSSSRRPTCDVCNKTFSSKANLRVHIRQHTGLKPFKCDWCSKCFNQRSTLRTHVRVHTGEKPYTCEQCNRAFADYSTFTKHQRTHSGERPYSCPTCGKSFAQSGNMIRHQQTHKVSDQRVTQQRNVSPVSTTSGGFHAVF